MGNHDNKGYRLIDSGKGKKLEQFGPYVIERPCSQAVWDPRLSEKEWKARAHASFSREGKSGWTFMKPGVPQEWTIETESHSMRLQPTDFGHLGIFPEQLSQWKKISTLVKRRYEKTKVRPKVLNLFAYSGGSTLASAMGGAAVCHLDASKGMVDWARNNAEINGLKDHPIRWIVEDVIKFCKREEKRGSRYDGIILDPPSFGRGSKGEVFKIEDEIGPLLSLITSLLTDAPLFVLFSCHTPGFTPVTMEYLLEDAFQRRKGLLSTHSSITSGEMLLGGAKGEYAEEGARPIPSGTYALFSSESFE